MESHFITAIGVITLDGRLLPPGLITKRGTDNPDGDQFAYFAKCPRYGSEKAFINGTLLAIICGL